MRTILHIFAGFDLYYTDPALHLITARWDPDDLDRDLYVRRVPGYPVEESPNKRVHQTRKKP